ncbi:hypothetical protein L21SP2_1140 [Salinispira pacifica]|uniref:Uncharacterized protein n=1 Tax=Salinispira pacifica TaxID=1307761 RepID=V5WF31_9SPIO|nr:hypothetical protein L21SP2_0345 [Salinispira pacifica]AHC14543.1 hypothetical protein L21SP2_1140 [Salinispira pacifica]
MNNNVVHYQIIFPQGSENCLDMTLRRARQDRDSAAVT